MEVQRLNDIIFVQFNACINDRKLLRKSDPMCARDEEQEEYVRDWMGGRALDLPEEIRVASSSTSSTTRARNIDEGIDDKFDDDDDDDVDDDVDVVDVDVVDDDVVDDDDDNDDSNLFVVEANE
jgi:hypothetical protein